MIRRAFPFLAATFLVACGGAADPSTSPAAETTIAATADTSVSAAPAPDEVAAGAIPDALQFSAPLVGGGDIELGELAGRPVLLWFWAPW